MHKFVTLVMLLVASASHAEWEYLTSTDDDKTEFFVERNAKKLVGKSRIWTLQNTKKSAEEGASSSKMLLEAECREGRIRVISAIGYTGEMGAGEVRYENLTPSEWAYPPPDSIKEAIWEELCESRSVLSQRYGPPITAPPGPDSNDWEYLTKTEDGETEFFIARSYKKGVSMPNVWILQNNAKPKKYGMFSTKMLVEGDCQKSKIRFLSILGHAERMGQGEVTFSDHTDTDWEFPAPYSINSLILKNLCSEKFP